MKATALVEAPDHVCSRYRIHAFEPWLERAGYALELQPLERNTFSRVRQLAGVRHAAVAILQRRLLPAWQLRLLRSAASRLVFDFDDAVVFRDSYDARGPVSRRRERRFEATVRAADVVIAGNDFLARLAIRAGADPGRVKVIPTCLQTRKYSPKTVADRKLGLDLVWIGSSSTLQGLERRRDLWDRIGREVPGVRLRVIADRTPDLGALPVVPVAWSEASESEELARGDVGISLVPDDLWSRGKCGLKVLQYQAVGLPVLANPVGVQAEMVQEGVSGFLPETDDAWVEAVRTLASDSGLRQQMGSAARVAVEDGFDVAAWGTEFAEAVVGVRQVKGPRCPDRAVVASEKSVVAKG